MDFHKIAAQVVFSRATFGPGERRAGIIAHIRKELTELEAATTQEEVVEEWTDLVILAVDGLTRAVRERERLRAEEFRQVNAEELGYDVEEKPRIIGPEDIASIASYHYWDKMERNIERDWPDWRDYTESDPIEHKRDG